MQLALWFVRGGWRLRDKLMRAAVRVLLCYGEGGRWREIVMWAAVNDIICYR